MKKIVCSLLCFLLVSCFKEPNKESNNENYEVSNETENSSTNNSTDFDISQTNNNVDSKKFVYVVIEISKPILKGFKSKYYDIKNSCHIEFVNEYRFSDIIEVQQYNEDVKYKLLDDAQKVILNQNQYINQNLYANAVVEYGYDAADEIKNENYSIKILNREIMVFDSYSEASKNLNNEK